MAHTTMVEQEHIRKGIVQEIKRLTALLDGFDNANSHAEDVALLEFGFIAKPVTA